MGINNIVSKNCNDFVRPELAKASYCYNLKLLFFGIPI